MKTLVQVKLDKALVDRVNIIIDNVGKDPLEDKITKSSIVRDAFVAFVKKYNKK